jgi:hypothetical protein
MLPRLPQLVVALLIGALSPAPSLAIAAAAPVACRQAAPERSSPFEMVRWNGVAPEVLVEGAWWRLVSIDGASSDKILAFARAQYGEKWAKRFCEDLVEVLTRMGHPPGATVELGLADLASGAPRVLERVALTEENRRRILASAPRPGVDAKSATPRVTRERSGKVAAPFEGLVRRYEALEARSPRLSAEQAREDLEQLEWLVANGFSYRDRSGVDWRAAFDALHARLGESISTASFQLQIHDLLALFGDGHTRLRASTSEILVPGVLPLRFVRDAKGVAVLDASGALLDSERPYLLAIDGERATNWLQAARSLGARGSPAFEDRTALRRAVHVGHLRAVLGRPAAPSARLSLGGARAEPREHEVALDERAPRAAETLRLDSRRLSDGVGYLKIARMDDDDAFTAELTKRLEELRGVRGLVLDVRGNGGGSREALRLVAPRLAPEGVEAFVANVAALRVPPGEDRAHAASQLANRFLYPRGWSGWSPAARAALEAHAAAFEPQWRLPENEFSEWCYLVLERERSQAPITAGAVVVLLDGGCFSATDIFLGALAQLPNVTLLGTPSGGGSGRAVGHVLAHSRLEVQLSSMVSFLPDGTLYDGAGIQPDVHVEPTLDDHLGRTDTALERAHQLARGR